MDKVHKLTLNIPKRLDINESKENYSIENKENLLNSLSNGSICFPISPKNSIKRITINDFDIISVLGKGSYAKVLHAKFCSSNKNVALKILNKSFMNKLNKSHEPLIEKEILSNLDHPNIVKLQMTFQDKEKLYFVLEYAPNLDLASFIKSQKVISFELSVFYSAEILNAIEYLKSKNIGHRDLKPENMTLDSNWHIKIVLINK
jgi:serine/threonine protein kinase